MAGLLPCSVGIHLDKDNECHKTMFTSSTGSVTVNDLPLEDQELIQYRTAIETLSSTDTICFHHQQEYLVKFEFMQKACCDPWRIHSKKKKKRNMKCVTLAKAKEANQLLKLKVIPGQKVCFGCYIKLNDEIAKNHQACEDVALDMDAIFEEDMDIAESSVNSLDDSFTSVGCSPLQLKKFSKGRRSSYGKRKLSQASKALQDTMANAIGVPSDSLESHSQKECKNCGDLSSLLTDLKEKCSISRKLDKIQILTLVPKHWTIEQTITEFGVTEYIARRARSLRESDGILAKPTPKTGKTLSNEVIEDVIKFYEDDQISRMCPGAKDFVSVKLGDRREHKQKRLILCNLKEVYGLFKERHQNHKIGFSKFCELRPKWCVTVSSSGSHNVCVCVIHQNTKLMIAALPVEQNFECKQLISHIVCNKESKECMLHRCENCPGKSALKNFLQKQIVDYDCDTFITFKQWVHTDRTTIIAQQLLIDDYLSELVDKVDALTAHDFIAKHQAAYLQNLKSELTEERAIVLLDFAENYSFIVQDAVQGFYWDNSQATLHPFTVYCIMPGEDVVQAKSFCVISDSMKHETATVYAFQWPILQHLKCMCPYVTKIIYFSDGAASQYKNKSNFSNLRHHKEDFGLEAEWNFFATSHGKSTCDGIGGTVKRLAARASLQQPVDNQILTPHQLYSWCCDNIINIKFFFVTNNEVASKKAYLQERFDTAKTITGTRDNHSFIPLSPTEIKVSRVSNDNSYFISSAGRCMPQMDIRPGQYIACIYDGHWWLGNVIQLSDQFEDAEIKFMHPHGPSASFKWPQKDDKCWVPFTHVLCMIPPPATTQHARQYTLSENTRKNINSRFQDLLESLT